ncbi:DEAD-box ATP-dependent RNA helicase 14 [Symbiodinium microadriaticum]|uniref:RNA helicase n=1 Tax=Symbiodinium microadriaticum TaxID=2951 RepID=A0A1Q9D8G2_SYMMI|nr:DEAD-box ATP-dependent RNA helicase 14 [Symbiodinium microadriaticum]
MADDEVVRIWDAWNAEITGTIDPWDTWDKVKERKGFPGGLIAFLQTSTDSEGCGFHQPTIVQDENAHLGLIVSFRETPCLVIYCYVAAALALYSFWCVRRSIRNAITLSQVLAQSGQTARRNPTSPGDRFLIVWCLGVTWFFFLIVNTGGQMIKQFGLRAPFRKAAVICVSVQERQDIAPTVEREETISSGYSRTLALRKKVGTRAVSTWGLRKGHAAFDALLAEGGLRTKGPSPQGFKSVEEMYRSSGPNRIPFEVDGWTQALTEEFSTLFFLYQFAIYAVCAASAARGTLPGLASDRLRSVTEVWFSYWHYTIIAMTIAVISGFFNTSVRLASQQSIKSMMEQQLTAHVLRDGQVVEVDANELVPGDILKVPCDLLLLRGAAVCDESTLTGESMPVQRLAPVEKLPDDPKGQLLLLILYPPKLVFKYDEQLSVLRKLPLTATWASGVFTCSCVLPTMLHIVLSVGQVISAKRLKDKPGHKPHHLTDKPASTESDTMQPLDRMSQSTVGNPSIAGLEFFGVHCVEMDGTDPGLQGHIEVKRNMFKASGWSLASQRDVRSPSGGSFEGHRLEILKRFDFSHSTMTMSAVVKHHPSGEQGIYCKGSFEHILRKCRPSSVPENFVQVAEAHAFAGMYVQTRADVEKDLTLLGCLLFKNPPRPDTAETILCLRAGDVMITGDAAGTAVSIAKDVYSSVSSEANFLTATFAIRLNEILLGNEWLTWRKNYKQWRGGAAAGARGEATMKAAKRRAHEAQEPEISRRCSWPQLEEVQNAGEETVDEDFVFSTEAVLAGPAPSVAGLPPVLIEEGQLESTNHQSSTNLLETFLLVLAVSAGHTSLLWELLTSIRIFARMTPNGKISAGRAMVGDGGNDSGALRAAHVGMALSSATSATVVAPFTTCRPSVAPIADLLREGRGALATSFAGYKYCVHYGLLNSVLKFKTYWHGISQSMMAAYFQVLSVVGMLGLNALFLEVNWNIITSDEEYVHKVRITQWWKLNRNWEITTLFFTYTFQLFWSAVVYSFGDAEQYTQTGVLYTRAVHPRFVEGKEGTADCFGVTDSKAPTLFLADLEGGERPSSTSAFPTFLLLSSPNWMTRLFKLVFEDVTDSDPWTRDEHLGTVQQCPDQFASICTLLVSALGFEAKCQAPRPPQAYAWAVLQSGKDLVGVAKTGSGKTLAFLLPGFVKLRKLKKAQEVDTKKGPALLCMTPTRELCHQIYSDAEKFGGPVQITAACCYGGANRKDQEWAIQTGPDCLIATPGRLNDFVQKKQVRLDQVRFAIIDEADRMLDMGFEPQIKQVLDEVPWHDRQTCMFTATWPQECKKLAETYIKDPVQIQIGSGEITTNKNIVQHVKMVDRDSDKLEALKEILRGLPEGAGCLVFCNSKKKCGTLSWDLEGDTELGMPATELHGDLDQNQRDKALWKFKSGEARVCVATDLASRGLDVRNIAVVVNYDAPKSAEDYVHRIGRTGRAEDSGEAYTLLLKWGNEAEAKYIAQIMRKASQDVPEDVQELEKNAEDDWKKDDWKKDEDWKQDDNSWKKEDDNWKKDDWQKNDSNGWNKKDEWNNDGKDDWSKKDDWKNNEGGWKRSAWSHEDEPSAKKASW